MTSTQVKVNRALSVPPVPFDLPLVAEPTASVTIAAPSAHTGPAPVQMRLISHELREGQVRYIPASAAGLAHTHQYTHTDTHQYTPASVHTHIPSNMCIFA